MRCQAVYSPYRNTVKRGGKKDPPFFYAVTAFVSMLLILFIYLFSVAAVKGVSVLPVSVHLALLLSAGQTQAVKPFSPVPGPHPVPLQTLALFSAPGHTIPPARHSANLTFSRLSFFFSLGTFILGRPKDGCATLGMGLALMSGTWNEPGKILDLRSL